VSGFAVQPDAVAATGAADLDDGATRAAAAYEQVDTARASAFSAGGRS
jgi:hypothetical protein